MQKVYSIILGFFVLLSILLTMCVFYYKTIADKRLQKLNIAELNLSNTQFNLNKANEKIKEANDNLNSYIELNNKLNKQIKLLNESKISTDAGIEVRQINCLFENIAKRGDCINDKFIED